MVHREPEVLAAGGVVLRRTRKGNWKVLVVHRPRHADWSLPKGKLDRGETFEDAAVREVEEETGVRCRLGAELPHVLYDDRSGRHKLVRWWLMEPVDGDAEARDPDHEIDEVRWVRVDRVGELLTYEDDAYLVEHALAEVDR